jgi:hypothetical protein
MNAANRSWLLWIAWFAVGLLTAVPGLTTRSLHYDEVLEIRQARLPIASQFALYVGPAVPECDSPPLYHFLLHPILKLSGVTLFSIRSLAWVAGALLVPVAFVLLRSLFPSRLAALGTLGFSLSSWRVELAQMGRPHGLVLLAAMLSLVSFWGLAAEGSRAMWLVYGLALLVVVQTSYWGLLVILPSHLLATIFLRKGLPYWRRAVAAQVAAGVTSVYYLGLLFYVYGKHSSSEPGVPRILAVPLFGRCLVLFGAGEFGKLDLVDLPFVAIVTLVVGAVVVLGVMEWRRSRGGLARWLGGCVGMWVVLLFLAHFAAASLAAWPMERKFALLLAPLLMAFVFGVASIRSPGWRYGAMVLWIAMTGYFALRSMTTDIYGGSGQVTRILAARSRPLVVYSNREKWLDFLLTSGQPSGGLSFRHLPGDGKGGFDWSAAPPDTRSGIVCVCMVREGGYLRGRLRSIGRGGQPPSLDGKMKSAARQLTERFRAAGWRPAASEYDPGRVSYQTECFASPVWSQSVASN